MYSILALNLLLAEDNPELQIPPFLPPPKSWDPSRVPPYLVYAVLKTLPTEIHFQAALGIISFQLLDSVSFPGRSFT